MGYEIAAGWGHAMANSGPGGLGGTPIVMVGDGTYMMMNSDIYSSVLSGHKMILVVCDNGGYAVINRLQKAKGVPGFNNLLIDCRCEPRAPLARRFRQARRVHGRGRAPLREPRRPRAALEWAKTTDRTTVLVDRLRRLHLGAGRCRLGRRRAAGLARANGAARRASEQEQSARSSASECESHESQTRNRAHRLVERRSRGTLRRRQPGGVPAAGERRRLHRHGDRPPLPDEHGRSSARSSPATASRSAAAGSPACCSTATSSAEKDRIRAQMDFFIAAEAPCIVYGETARSIQGVRSAPLATKPKLSEDEIKAYGRKMTAFAEWCAEQGMPISYHHHMAAAIETEPELDLLMANSGEALPLLFDAGHMAFAGGDVLRVIDKHHKRISHVHTKDVRRERDRQARPRQARASSTRS